MVDQRAESLQSRDSSEASPRLRLTGEQKGVDSGAISDIESVGLADGLAGVVQWEAVISCEGSA